MSYSSFRIHNDRMQYGHLMCQRGHNTSTFGQFGHPRVSFISITYHEEMPKDGKSESVAILPLGRSGTVPAGGGNLVSISRNRRGGLRITIILGIMVIIFEWPDPK